MKDAGIYGVVRRKHRQTPLDTNAASYPDNLLARCFSAEAANLKWVTDITYIRTYEGWLYLAVVLDLFSRQVVGWSMGSRIDTGLVLDSLMMALWRRKPTNSRGLATVTSNAGRPGACTRRPCASNTNSL